MKLISLSLLISVAGALAVSGCSSAEDATGASESQLNLALAYDDGRTETVSVSMAEIQQQLAQAPSMTADGKPVSTVTELLVAEKFEVEDNDYAGTIVRNGTAFTNAVGEKLVWNESFTEAVHTVPEGTIRISVSGGSPAQLESEIAWLTLVRLNVDLDTTPPATEVMEDKMDGTYNPNADRLWGIHYVRGTFGLNESHWAYVDMRGSKTGIKFEGPGWGNNWVLSAYARCEGTKVMASVDKSGGVRNATLPSSFVGSKKRCAVKAINTNKYSPLRYGIAATAK